MKQLLWISAALLLFGIAELPIGYYTLLRIVVTLTAGILFFDEFNEGPGFWLFTSGIIAILFNPIMPIYFNDKSTWAVIDLVTGVLFIIKSFNLKTKKNE